MAVRRIIVGIAPMATRAVRCNQYTGGALDKGGKDKVILQRVSQDTRLTYSTVLRWAKRDVERVDTPIPEIWCKYLGVGVGDILEYVLDG